VTSSSPFARLGEAVARHPWWSIGAWVALVAVTLGAALIGFGGGSLFDRMANDAFRIAGEASDGQALLDPGVESSSVTLLVHGASLDSPELASGFADAAAASEAIAGTVRATDPVGIIRAAIEAASAQLPPGAPAPTWTDVKPMLADSGIGALLAEDERGALLTVTVEADGPDVAVDEDAVYAVIDALQAEAAKLREALPGAVVEVGSSTQLIDSIFAQTAVDLARGESVALPIALLIMLIVFGGLIAAGLPLALAGTAIAGAMGILYALTFFMDINPTVLNVVTAVGLGLSIDYGLLIVSRFREEIRAGRGSDQPPGTRRDAAGHPAQRRAARIAAVGRTIDGAGRTAAFSGTVFAIAAAGLLLFEPATVRSIGIGALLVAALSVVSALTLMPALLSLLGERLAKPGILTRIPGIGAVLSRFGDVAPAEGVFSRLTRLVQKAPAIITVVGVGALVWLGSPIANLQIANTATDVIPVSSEQHDFFETLRGKFPEAATPRVALVTEDEASLRRWAAEVERLDGVEAVGQAREQGEAWVAAVQLGPRDGIRLVPEIRDARPDGLAGWTVGQDASTYDLGQSLLRDAPWAVLLIGLATFLFLFLTTGSFVLPIKALLLSALSLSAAVGVLVWGFEDGHLAGVLGFDAGQIHGVDVLVLLLALVFGFGLAMDYELFILSRIMDLKQAGASTREAIALGLQRSGRIITSAALIIIVVFGGFASGDLPLIQGLGVALAAAVLLDATLVRMILVPAVMTWAARIIFWAPRWAKRLHARVGFAE